MEATLSEGYLGHSPIRDISEARALKDVDEILRGSLLDAVNPIKLYTEHGPVPNWRGIANAETNQIYNIATEKYTPLQNSEAFKWMEDLVIAGDAIWAQGATIGGGGTAWLSIMSSDMVLKQQDGSSDHLEQLLWSLNDHTGKSSHRLGELAHRLYCNNQIPTISKALENQASFRHTATIKDRISLATGLLKKANLDWKETAPMFQHLANKHITDVEFRELSSTILDEEYGPAINPETNANTKHRENSIEELETYFGTGNQGAGATAWGALQSVTGWIDHKLAMYDKSKLTASKIESHFRSSQIGKTASLKRRALNQLVTA